MGRQEKKIATLVRMIEHGTVASLMDALSDALLIVAMTDPPDKESLIRLTVDLRACFKKFNGNFSDGKEKAW